MLCDSAKALGLTLLRIPPLRAQVLNNNLRDGEHSGQIVSIELAEREVEHARKMHHPNIVRLLDVFYSSPDKERLVIVVRGACGR